MTQLNRGINIFSLAVDLLNIFSSEQFNKTAYTGEGVKGVGDRGVREVVGKLIQTHSCSIVIYFF